MITERGRRAMRAVAGRGLACALLLALALPVAAAPWSLRVEAAEDGALLLRDVQADVGDTGLTVSGRIHRTRLTRLIAGRVVEIRVEDAQGVLRARRSVAVDVARLPRRGGAGQGFATLLAITPADTDRVVVALRRGPPAD